MLSALKINPHSGLRPPDTRSDGFRRSSFRFGRAARLTWQARLAFTERTLSARIILVPIERAPALLIDDSGFKAVLFFLEADHFRHPREGIIRSGIERIKSDLLRAAIGHVTQVFLEHRRVQAQLATRHGVLGVTVFELDSLLDQPADFLAELLGPEMRIFHLDLVDQIDAEIAVHGLVAQDVLILLGGAHHLVLPAERQDLGKADIEEQSLHDAGEYD